MRGIGRTIMLGLLVLIVSAGGARAEAVVYSLAVGRADSHAYAVSVGVAMLAKINVLPHHDIDLDIMVSESSSDSIKRLLEGEAQLAMIDPDDIDPAMARAIASIAMIWQTDETAPLLAARHDVPPEVVYQVTKVIFENLPSLQTIDTITTDTHLDAAVANLTLPLHEGAKRYYRQLAVALPDIKVPLNAVANVAEPSSKRATGQGEVVAWLPASEAKELQWDAGVPASGQSRKVAEAAPSATGNFFGQRSTRGLIGARTFVLYFDLDETTLDLQSQATLAEVQDFADQLGEARAWVAGYADSRGTADADVELARRRVDVVVEALGKIGLKANVDATALDQPPWVVDGEGLAETPDQRRVEIMLELAPSSGDLHGPRSRVRQEAAVGPLM